VREVMKAIAKRAADELGAGSGVRGNKGTREEFKGLIETMGQEYGGRGQE